jgi:hypothetical protein
MSFALASLIIYTANNTAAAAVYVKGKGEVKDKSKDESEVEDEDNAISKFILLSCF